MNIRRLVLGAILALLLVFSLTGCDFISSLFNPLLGTWKNTETSQGMTATSTFTLKSDNTWTMVTTGSGTISGISATESITGSGTFTQDTGAKTITMDGTIYGSTTANGQTNTIPTQTLTKSVMNYSLSSDNITLTLTDPTSSKSTVYTRESPVK